MKINPRTTAAVTLGAIFAFSILLRLPMLNGELCHLDEWLASTVLRHLQVWDQVGIAKAHFAPIMTYPGAANRNINNNASDHHDDAGNYYYTSYPPLAYYVPYFAFEILGTRPSILGLEVMNLALHFISGLFVYLTVRALMPSRAAAFSAFVIYIFAPETLRFQSNVYMSDMFAQPLFVMSIYLVIRLTIAKSVSVGFCLRFGTLIFLFAYSEWLGVLFALSLAMYLLNRPSIVHGRPLLLTTIVSVCAAVLLTLWQYSLISGWKSFLTSATSKFLFRSGLSRQVGLKLHLWNLLPWMLIGIKYILGYGACFVLLLCLWVLLRISKPAVRVRPSSTHAIVYSALVPVILHQLIFFNFTANHLFAVLKAAPLFAVVGSVLVSGIWESKKNVFRATTTGLLALYCGVGIWEARLIAGPCISGYKVVGETIARNSSPADIIFVTLSGAKDPGTFDPPPQTVFYAHRNLAVWRGAADAAELANKDGVRQFQLFTLNSDGTSVLRVQRLTAGQNP